MITFSEQDLLESFDPVTVQRGKTYARQGKVDKIESQGGEDGSLEVKAKVRGQYAPHYQVHVWLDFIENGWLIDDNCSCPVGGGCKHVVAALLKARELLERDAQRLATDGAGRETVPNAAMDAERMRREEVALLEWLDLLQQRAVPAAQPAQECLLYQLSADSLGRVRLGVFKARRRRDGSFAVPQSYSNVQNVTLGWNRPRFMDDSDQRILLHLRGHQDRYWSGFSVNDATSAEAVRLAVLSGRCYWQNWESPALTWSERLSARLDWRREADGRLRLALEDLAEGVLVVPCEPLLYIDPTRNLCGELQLPVGAEQAKALLAAPPLSPDTLSLRLPELSPILEKLAVPAPPDVCAPRLVSNLHPQPHLFLYAFPVGRGKTKADQRAVDLSYRYGDYRIPWFYPEPLLRTQQDSELVLIQRDQAAENQARDRLPGFAPLYERLGRHAPQDIQRFNLTARDEVGWLDFLAYQLPILEQDGWIIEFDKSFPLSVIEPEDWYGETKTHTWDGWFDLELGIVHGGRRINLVPLLLQGLRRLRSQPVATDNSDKVVSLELPEFLWLHDGESLLRVPSQRVRPMLEILQELFQYRSPDKQGRLAVSPVDGARVLGESEINWQGGEQLRALSDLLKNFSGLPHTELPAGFHAELRPYQQQGLDWMQFLRQGGLGGLLADDMGLGKTIQTLAHLWTEKVSGRLTSPTLVVCPTSLLPNWRSEAARFTPGLRVLTLHGNNRKESFSRIGEHDLVLTTYALLSRDRQVLSEQEFHALVFDEAQNLKNPRTRTAEAALALRGGHRIALTGTPMENHLGELWSLFNLLLPGYLGNSQEFQRLYRNPIEQQGDRERSAMLTRRIKPFLLRRTKEKVAPELPSKTEIIRTVTLEGAQRDLYETIRAGMDQKVNQLLTEKGLANSHIEILDALLKLRQICCDPRLLSLTAAPRKTASAKLSYLLELLESLMAEGRRVLLFSQFTSMLTLIEAELTQRNIPYVLLTGQTQDRATPVESFQSGEVPLFLISLKAGGVGLNLVAADVVIHFDPWWNPAVENQATDRAYRIGQDKPVFVYKLICEGTVEERMLALQASKSALADSVYGNESSFTGALSAEDIRELFQPLMKT